MNVLLKIVTALGYILLAAVSFLLAIRFMVFITSISPMLAAICSIFFLYYLIKKITKPDAKEDSTRER